MKILIFKFGLLAPSSVLFSTFKPEGLGGTKVKKRKLDGAKSQGLKG